MDVLKIIANQIKDLKALESSAFLDQIYNHLERAELYYNNGLIDGHFFNDVVYRTNQAFEGSIKEAYKVLGEKTDEETLRITPYNIEKFFKENNIFKERVLKLFENYRKEWRNESTHDYSLILDENEAFLALVNVTSFVHLLLKQTQEKVSYNRVFQKPTSASLKQGVEAIKASLSSLSERVISLIKLFNKEELTPDLNESQMMGMLYAFLVKSDDSLLVSREPSISNEFINIRPDFIIASQEESIILEVRRLSHLNDHASVQQVARYLELTGITKGIVYMFTTNVSKIELNATFQSISKNDNTFEIAVIR
jgi:hypothetical protein